MTIQQSNLKELSPRKINGMNLVGLQTLIQKEVGRFINVYTQTIIAPVMTTLLFYAVFALAFGGVTRTIGDIPYLDFLAPGLIMMTMVQNAFANTSSSMVIAKVQGNIVDVLMPPLSPAELYLGFVIGGIVRGLCVGIVAAGVWSQKFDHIAAVTNLIVTPLTFLSGTF